MEAPVSAYVPFLSMAFAVNLLQLWDGIGNWIEKRAERHKLSNEALVTEGPSDSSCVDELERRNKRCKDGLDRGISRGKKFGGGLAGVIYLAVLGSIFVSNEPVPLWLGLLVCAVAGFAWVVWIWLIMLWHWCAIWRVDRWVISQTRAGAIQQREERQNAAAKVRRSVERRVPGSGQQYLPGLQANFDLLRRHLSRSAREGQPFGVPFAQIEALTGVKLPRAATLAKEWWFDSSFARRGWIHAGFTVRDVDFEAKRVYFQSGL